MRQRSNRVSSNNSSCSRPLKLSTKAFCTGLPRCDVIQYLRRSSWVGDHDDVIKLPCHPNAGDRRERLKALSAADEISVVFERLAQRYRVIAFVRLGFGHTNQPKSRTWTPTAQAERDISVSGR
jgi:hypothetical protein